MKTIIAGSRGIIPLYGALFKIQEIIPWTITEVVSGTAKGVDITAQRWANSIGIPVKEFPANWDFLGREAGYLRNVEMANYADALIAIWDGQSRGTQHMINIAEERELLIRIYSINNKLRLLQRIRI